MSIFDTITLFSDLNEREKKTLENFTQLRFLKKGEKLFSEGESASTMYIVKKGVIKIYKESSEKEVGFVGPDETIGELILTGVLGEMGVFEEGQHRRMASAIAEEDSEIFVIVDFSIKELSKKHPGITDKIKLIIQGRTLENKINNI